MGSIPEDTRQINILVIRVHRPLWGCTLEAAEFKAESDRDVSLRVRGAGGFQGLILSQEVKPQESTEASPPLKLRVIVSEMDPRFKSVCL